ncbi:MAG: hypothetical protein Q8P99_00320 [bacterium]|nr:hypothetical protein [bacterium]MDZ4231193.1 DUF6580 family putative transport protein [Patescibacteria group bacterium]
MGLFILVVALRLAPHAPNFVPVGALALFAGAYFPKRWGYGVPLAAVLATDVLIGFYDLKLMAVVYLSHLLGVGLGYLMRSRVNTGNVLLGAVGGAVAFFLTTNFAVWLFSSWYAHTLPGLLLAYEYGLPFFRNTLLSNLVYSGAFFGVYEFAKRYVFKPGSELTKARA